MSKGPSKPGKVVIYHNPRCTKSRKTLDLLSSRGLDTEVIEYLKDPPSTRQIADLLTKLGLTARALMRTHEEIYSTLRLADVNDDAALIRAMHAHPVLIERPIVVAGDRARIGRPPEAVLDIL